MKRRDVPGTPQPPPIESRSKAEYVLTLGEAAIRLSLSIAQLEGMIAAGTIEALPTGYTRTIPTLEIAPILAGRQ